MEQCFGAEVAAHALDMESPIKFIFFDVGNTLLFPNRERIHAPLAERGLTPDAALLRDLERSTKNEFDACMVKNGSTDHSFWWMFYSQLLARIGVISNADGKIEDLLRRCNIADCFLTITDSGLVGFEKPHPEIFRQALQSMNAKPEESFYIGDLYSIDYLGATGAGMQAILMDVPGAYLERGVQRVESLKELNSVLP